MAIGIKPATFSLFKSEDLANTGLSYKVKLRAMQVNFRMIIYTIYTTTYTNWNLHFLQHWETIVLIVSFIIIHPSPLSYILLDRIVLGFLDS